MEFLTRHSNLINKTKGFFYIQQIHNLLPKVPHQLQ